jgi:hypothetical protein
MSRPALDITNQTFNGITAIKRVGSFPNGSARWEFKCHCGNTFYAPPYTISAGRQLSCGCASPKTTQDPNRITRRDTFLEESVYNSWKAMMQRCTNPNSHNYERYAVRRGITVCDRWKDFRNFKTDMGPKPSTEHSLHRIDNSGNYEPTNCKWATREEQYSNRR